MLLRSNLPFSVLTCLALTSGTARASIADDGGAVSTVATNYQATLLTTNGPRFFRLVHP
jgi:hypothetical protein